MRRRRPFLALAALTPWLLPVACFAVGEGILPLGQHHSSDAGPPTITVFDGGPNTVSLDASELAPPPHSVASVDPSHGPFDGGEHAIVRGSGFTSAVRVWFGPNEVAHDTVVAIDPSHVQVTVPAGSAGIVDVAAQNGDDTSTRTTLPEGYVYDSFYLDPSSGPVSGGTIVTLHGDRTAWDLTTKVSIDGAPCDLVAVRSPAGKPQELDCRTPAGTPGSKSVQVLTEGGSTDVLDAFTYGDSSDGFSGGLSGNPLSGTLRVVVLNSATGRALGGATVVLGGDVTATSVKTADANGVVVIADSTLGSKQTVTVAARCFMPTTFVDVPVDTVTAYLDPILSPDCAANGQPTGIGQGGGSTENGASITGELVWPSDLEFKRGRWDVPIPAGYPDANSPLHLTAYVFQLASDVTQTFRLPAASHATTQDDVGALGYTFSTTTSVGNLTLYALAGIENRSVSPPLFTAYTMGVVSGVAANPGATTTDVYIPMNIPLDHALTLTITGPSPTARGPDHVDARVGIRVGTLGYVTLPVGTASTLLPVTTPLSVVGLPPLVDGLLGAEYVTTAVASTGASDSPPLSALGLTSTAGLGGSVALDGFVEIPHLDVPGDNGSWDGQSLSASSHAGGPEPDLALFEIASALSTWTVAAPKGTTTVRLPDLSTVNGLAAPSGPVAITVSFAQIDGFDYGSLRYRQLAPRGWDAYATDTFQAHR